MNTKVKAHKIHNSHQKHYAEYFAVVAKHVHKIKLSGEKNNKQQSETFSETLVFNTAKDKFKVIRTEVLDGEPESYASPYSKAVLSCVNLSKIESDKRYSGLGFWVNGIWDGLTNGTYKKFDWETFDDKLQKEETKCVETETKAYEKSDQQPATSDGFIL